MPSQETHGHRQPGPRIHRRTVERRRAAWQPQWPRHVALASEGTSSLKCILTVSLQNQDAGNFRLVIVWVASAYRTKLSPRVLILNKPGDSLIPAGFARIPTRDVSTSLTGVHSYGTLKNNQIVDLPTKYGAWAAARVAVGQDLLGPAVHL